MWQQVRRLSETVSLVSVLFMAAPAQALDRPAQQVLLQPRIVEINVGLLESFGEFDLDTNFNNSASESYSRTREFVGIGIDMPVIDLDGTLVRLGANGRFFLDSTLFRSSFDFHPTQGDDVRIKVTNNVQVTPFVAVDFPLDSLLGELGVNPFARLFAGATVGDYRNIIDIDETGGAGNRERFSESGVRITPTIGGEIVLGGLIRNDSVDVGLKLTGEVSTGRVPGLSDISFLGNLYRSKAREEARVGLMVIVTPRLVSPAE